MTNHLTENDLRSALISLAPADLDATDFRARLDALTVNNAAAAVGVDDGAAIASDAQDMHVAGVLPLTAASTGRRSRRARVVLAATLAACAAAIAALTLAVLPIGDRHAHSGPTAGVPSPLEATLLPGTIVLKTYRGTGSAVFRIPAHTVPRYFQYAAYGTCSGGGSLMIFDAGELQACDGSTTFGTSGPPGSTSMPVTAPTRTSWAVTLVIEPQARTNGSVQSPPGDAAGPDNGLRQHGRGSATVTFTGATAEGAPTNNYSVRLICTGNGVHLPDLNGHANDGGPLTTGGLATDTCFAGHEYVWQSVPLHLPRAIRVTASPRTSWTIFLDPTN